MVWPSKVQGCLAHGLVHCGKGQRSCRKLNIENSKVSDGWLAGFKSHRGIKLQRPKGESGSADLEGVGTACTVVGQMISELDCQLEDRLSVS